MQSIGEMGMKNISKKRVQELRRERNASILRRMANGDPLTAFNSVSSWFPPRPTIKKNEEDVEALYGMGLDRRLQHERDENELAGELDAEKSNPMRIA